MEKNLKNLEKKMFAEPKFSKIEVEVQGFCVASGKPAKVKATVNVESYDQITNEIEFE